MTKARIPEPKRTAAGLSAMLADGTIPTDYAYGQRVIFVSDFQAFIDQMAKEDGRQGGNAGKYPFTSLMVGQSFTVPGGREVAESVRNAARHQTDRRGWHFRIERLDRETIRVTRVATPEAAVVGNDDRLTRYPWKGTEPGERFFVAFKPGLLPGQARHAIRAIIKARTKNRPAENYEIDWTDTGGWIRRVAAAAMLWLLGAGVADAQAMRCGLWEEIRDGVEGSTYAETPVWLGPVGNGGSVWVLFMNRTTGSWTLVQRFPDKACIVAGGKRSDPVADLSHGEPV